MQDKIIDAHNHPDWYGFSADKFIAEMDSHGIDKTWLLTWEAPANEVEPDQFNLLSEAPYSSLTGPINFARCRAFKEKYPNRFILGYAPDPRLPEAMDNLEAAISLYDIKVCGEIKLRMTYDNPDAIDYFNFCGKKNLPVTLHIENPIPLSQKYPRRHYWYGGGIETLERLLQKCPYTNFLGHAMGFWCNISADEKGLASAYPSGPVIKGGKLLQLLRQYPNLYCDISAKSGRNALQRDPSFAKEFLDEFQDRVLFARDCFGGDHLEFINSLELPQTIREKVFTQNALKLVKEV